MPDGPLDVLEGVAEKLPGLRATLPGQHAVPRQDATMLQGQLAAMAQLSASLPGQVTVPTGDGAALRGLAAALPQVVEKLRVQHAVRGQHAWMLRGQLTMREGHLRALPPSLRRRTGAVAEHGDRRS